MSQQAGISRQGSNAVAVVGLVLAVPLWPLGAILSAIGLVRANRLGGAGRTLGIVGLALSLLVGAGSITFVAMRGHKSVDVGCSPAEAQVTALRNSVATYKTEIRSAESSNDSTAAMEDIDSLVVELESEGNQFRQAESTAVSADLRKADETMVTDLAAVVADYRATEDNGQSDQIGADSTTVMNDAGKVDAFCG